MNTITMFKFDFNSFADKGSDYFYYLVDYYTRDEIFILKDGELKFYGTFHGKDNDRYINFYDIDKKERYFFHVEFIKGLDLYTILNMGFLESEEGKEYYKHYYIETNTNKDYIRFDFFRRSVIFKKGILKIGMRISLII